MAAAAGSSGEYAVHIPLMKLIRKEIDRKWEKGTKVQRDSVAKALEDALKKVRLPSVSFRVSDGVVKFDLVADEDQGGLSEAAAGGRDSSKKLPHIVLVRNADPLSQLQNKWVGSSDADRKSATELLLHEFEVDEGPGNKQVLFPTSEPKVLFLLSRGGHRSSEEALKNIVRYYVKEEKPVVPIIRSRPVWPQVVLGWKDGKKELQQEATVVLEKAIKYKSLPEICFPSAANPSVKFYLVQQYYFDASPPPTVAQHSKLLDKFPLLRFEGKHMFPQTRETTRRYYHEIPDVLDHARHWLRSLPRGIMVTGVIPDEDS